MEDFAGLAAGDASTAGFAFLTFFADAVGTSASVFGSVRLYETRHDEVVLLRFKAFVSGAIAAVVEYLSKLIQKCSSTEFQTAKIAAASASSVRSRGRHHPAFKSAAGTNAATTCGVGSEQTYHNPPTCNDLAMSFNDSSALESQPTNWRREDDPQYSDDPEFRRFTTELSDKLFGLTSSVSRLRSQIDLLGTKRETERVRERIRDLIDETSNGFKEIGEGLKRVSAWHDLGVRTPPHRHLPLYCLAEHGSSNDENARILTLTDLYRNSPPSASPRAN